MKIKDIMITDLPEIRPEQTVRETARILSELNADSLPVTDETGRLVGLVTKSDVLRVLVKFQDPNLPVSGIVRTTEIRTVDPEDTVEDCMLGQGCLPVVHAGRLVGICTEANLARAVIEKTRRTCEDLFSIINSVCYPLVLVDNRGEVRLVNRSAEQLLGKKADEIVGKNARAGVLASKLFEAIKIGKTEAFQKIKIDGRCFLCNRTPVVREGKIIGVVALIQDISELEYVSRELRKVTEESAELNTIIDSSFDGLLIADSEGKVLRANRAYERITGIKVRDVIGKAIEALMDSSALAVLKKGEPVSLIEDSPSGRKTLITGNPVLSDNGEVLRIVINVRDIEELDTLKQELGQIRGLSRHYEHQNKQLRVVYSGDKLVVRSDKMKRLVDLVMRLARVDSTVLIQGESGVGKELIAETIHKNSPRRNGPFVKVNCGAIPENLLESELFGYEDGAFTGARREGKPGLFEVASGGTLFLDEVGELPLNLQVKLLRTIQEKEVTRVGGARPVKVDIRIIAGSNRDLAAMVKAKKFREDLYYRLNVVPVYVPPLRERKEEIPDLVAHFLNRFNNQYNLNKKVADEVVGIFMDYDWPGNIRELENLVERLIVTTPSEEITRDELPSYLFDSSPEADLRVSVTDVLPLKHAIESVERQILEKAFSRYKSTRRVAKELGINQSTVVRKAAKYNIVAGDA